MKVLRSYKLWLGISLVIFILAMRYIVRHNVSLLSIQDQHEHLMTFVNDHYISSVLIYILLYALIAVFALPLPALFTLVGGFLFGTLRGAIFSNIGATSGAILFFLIIRYSLGRRIQNRYKAQLKNFNLRIKKYGISYLIAIRSIVFIPFFLQNAFIGLTNVSLVTFLWTTSLGILPTSLIFSYAGQQFAHIDSIRDVFSGHMLMAFILLAFLGFMPIMIQRYLDSR